MKPPKRPAARKGQAIGGAVAKAGKMMTMGPKGQKVFKKEQHIGRASIGYPNMPAGSKVISPKSGRRSK